MITNFEEDELDPSDPPAINSFAITDSYNQTTTNPDFQLHINAGISAGQFVVSYNINAEAYYVTLAVNNVNTSTGSLVFYNSTCGSTACTADITCAFTNSMTMYCGIVGPSNPEVDVSSKILAIPTDAYLVIQVCNSDYSICSEYYQSVELQ